MVWAGQSNEGHRGERRRAYNGENGVAFGAVPKATQHLKLVGVPGRGTEGAGECGGLRGRGGRGSGKVAVGGSGSLWGDAGG